MMGLATGIHHVYTSLFLTCRPCLSRGSNSVRCFVTSGRQNAQSPLADLARNESSRNAALALTKIFGSKESSSDDPDSILNEMPMNPRDVKLHHFHVYSTKHNTHITLTNPERNSIISISTGNIGFRKAARGTYDAAYQLAAYVFGRIYEAGLLTKIKKLEVVLRGFGVGREAVTKALLGAEGRLLRQKVTQVSDATRLKFGGTRSKKPRRLG